MCYTHTMKYFSALKRKEILPHNMDEPWGYYAQWNEPIAKSYMYDSMYMIYPEQSDSQKQKTEWWLPGTGREENGES